jgi:hypothetical protein
MNIFRIINPYIPSIRITNPNGRGQISGGTQNLGDFFHNGNGMLTQLKSTVVTKANSVSATISKYKKVIEKLAEVKANGTFTTKNNQILNVLDARLDIIVPQGYNISILENALQSYNNLVSVKFIIK